MNIRMGDRVCWLHSAVFPEGGHVLPGYVQEINENIATVKIHRDYHVLGLYYIQELHLSRLMLEEEYDKRYDDYIKERGWHPWISIQIFLDLCAENIKRKNQSTI